MNEQQPFNDELISAFLDGETTPEEQARVEERLMDSVEDRHLFEDLKALGQRMQSLPQEQLGKDLTSQILRRAERRMLEVEADTTADEDDSPPETEPPVADPPVERRATDEDRGQWRGMIWAGAAVAIVLVLMFINRDPGNESDMAEDTVAHKTDVDESGDEAKKSNAVVDREESDSALEDAKRPSERFLGMKETSRDSDESGAVWKADAPGPADVPDPTSGLRGSVVEDDAGADPFDGEKVADASPKVVPSKDGGKVSSFDRTHGHELNSSGDGSMHLDRARSMGNRADDWKRKSTSPAESREYAVDRLAQLAGDRMLVVNLDVKPVALQEQSFDRSLAKHRILVESFAKQSASAGRTSSGRDNVAATTDSGNLSVVPGAGKASGEVELVYVEAPVDRVAAVLDELALRPDQFQLVSMDDGSRVPYAAGPMPLKEEAKFSELEKKAEAAKTKDEYGDSLDREQPAEAAAEAFGGLTPPAREKGGAVGTAPPPGADLPIEAPMDSAVGEVEPPDLAVDSTDDELPAKDPRAEELPTADEPMEKPADEPAADKPMTEPTAPAEPVAPATPAMGPAETPEESPARPDDVVPSDTPAEAPALTAPTEDMDAVEEAETDPATDSPAPETTPRTNETERRADSKGVYDLGDDDTDTFGAPADEAESLSDDTVMPERDETSKDEEAEQDPVRGSGPQSLGPGAPSGVGGGGSGTYRGETEGGWGGRAAGGAATPDSIDGAADHVEPADKQPSRNGKRDEQAAKKRTESKYEGIARKLYVPNLGDKQRNRRGVKDGIRLDSSLIDAIQAEGHDQVKDAFKPKSAANNAVTRPRGGTVGTGDEGPAKMVRVLFVLRSVPADANVVGAEAAAPPAAALEADAAIRARATGDAANSDVIPAEQAPVKE